jgi:hypothetical protein
VEVSEGGERRAGLQVDFFAAGEIGGVGRFFAVNGNVDLSLAALALLGVFLIATDFHYGVG